jgi:hypothetical protein
MEMQLSPPLSNVQLELLKRYAANVSDETLVELRKVMSKFFFDKMRQQADAVWQEKGYSDEFFLNNIINENQKYYSAY